MTKMKLVPAEPTFGMVDVGDVEIDTYGDSSEIYNTMVRVSPNGGKVSQTRFKELVAECASKCVKQSVFGNPRWITCHSPEDTVRDVIKALGLEVEE